MTTVSPTDDQVLAAVATWLKATLGITVIQAFQSGDLPPVPYGVVHMGLSNQLTDWATDIEYDDSVEEDIKEAHVIAWEWMVTLNLYGPNASNYARQLSVAIHHFAVRSDLLPYEVHRVSNARNLPEPTDLGYEERSNMDLFIHGYVKDYSSIDVIEEAPVTVETT